MHLPQPPRSQADIIGRSELRQQVATLLRQSYEARTNQVFDKGKERMRYELCGLEWVPKHIHDQWGKGTIRTFDELTAAVSPELLRNWVKTLEKSGPKIVPRDVPYWVDKHSKLPIATAKSKKQRQKVKKHGADSLLAPNIPSSLASSSKLTLLESSSLGKRGRHSFPGTAAVAGPSNKRAKRSASPCPVDTMKANHRPSRSPSVVEVDPPDPSPRSKPLSRTRVDHEPLKSRQIDRQASAEESKIDHEKPLDYFLSPTFPGVRFPYAGPSIDFAVREAERLQGSPDVSPEFKYSHLGHLLLQTVVSQTTLHSVIGAAGMAGPGSLAADLHLVNFLAKEVEHPGTEDLFRYLSVLFAAAASFSRRARLQREGAPQPEEDFGELEVDLRNLEEEEWVTKELVKDSEATDSAKRKGKARKGKR
ncbi:hypothetical protein MIND_01169700 [Mycena indigotica]|uniref:Uncharacterized protein n=1 Tax=Mycena indigotica TaxID=2126181 RepID=A0A8H6S4F4_9AGAR|nr:uncharacterized protein MIND_01169700 [Mycena indigotica]KAF7292714.1 hypothetical protein MIND_01169700 [Mycena indigotica]